MHLAKTTAMGLALTLGLGAATADAQSLTTTFAAGNSHYGAMFNFKVTEPLTVDSFDVHFRNDENPVPCAAACSVVEVEVYYVTGGGGFKIATRAIYDCAKLPLGLCAWLLEARSNRRVSVLGVADGGMAERKGQGKQQSLCCGESAVAFSHGLSFV